MRTGERVSSHEDSNFPNNNTQIKELLLRRAKERGASLKWNANSLILAYTILALTIILAFRSVNIAVIALVAVSGLAIIWGFSYQQAKRIERDFLKNEIRDYLELLASRTRETPKEIAPAPVALPVVESPLTDRELQVIQLLGEGRSNKETAATLHISDQTVKNHISHIFAKLGVNDRTSAVLMAISNGWIKKTEHEHFKPVLDKDL
jgi:ATP/maltotriose-dependent transcriptional regulator MalT